MSNSLSRGIARASLALRCGVVAAVSLPGAALAADMPDIGFAPPPMVQEFGSNWYLRGDIGYTFQNASMSGSAELLFLRSDDPGDYYSRSFGEGSFDDTWVIGGGFGVRATEWLRFDTTIDYRASASGTAAGEFSVYDPLNNNPWSPANQLTSVDTDLSTTLLLANAYLDLGTWGGFTPYVGAGIGAGYLDLGGVDIANVGSADFDGKWGFAWALMAGASFEVGPNLLIDIGYRYSSIAGSTFSSQVDGVDGTNPMGTINVNVDDINTQEVRIGARYIIE